LLALGHALLHLRDQPPLELAVGLEHGARIAALRVEMGADRPLERLRAGQHRLGLRRPKPGVVVAEKHAEMPAGAHSALGRRPTRLLRVRRRPDRDPDRGNEEGDEQDGAPRA